MQSYSQHPKIFFITDKWSGGNKNYGLSEWENGLLLSLQSTGLAEVDTFHFDDYYITNGKMGDEALLQKISEYQPDFIFLATNKMPGTATKVPNWSTFDTIKNKLKIPLVAIWSDIEMKEQVGISKALLPYTVLNPSTASTAAINRINRPDKYIYTWVPRDPRIFNNPNKQRDIDVGYVGSPRKNRLKHLIYLIHNKIKVTYGGGEGHEHLAVERYTDRYQRSKIALSFARAHNSHVVNARPFEVMLCGAMLLEQESFELMKLYVPYVDYVPYTSKTDMLRKAQYYLSHDEERQKIALNGQRKTETLYSAKRFWELVIEKTLGAGLEETDAFDYAIPKESLAQLSAWTAFKMRFLNWLCGTKTRFIFYKAFNVYFWEGVFRKIWYDIFFVSIRKMKPFLERKMPKKKFEFILKVKRKIIKK